MFFNGAQLHLLVNHIPVVGFFGVVLGLAFAMWSPSQDIKRFVLVVTAIVGFSSLASYFSGDPAEHVILGQPGVKRSLIEEHEDAAKFATILAVLTAVTASAGFFIQRKRPEFLNRSMTSVFMLSLLTAAAMAKTAHEGGQIRHPEVRAGGEGMSVPSETRDE